MGRRKPLSLGDWIVVGAIGATAAVATVLGEEMEREIKSQTSSTKPKAKYTATPKNVIDCIDYKVEE